MHTTRINQTLFHHNGGFDGDVTIVSSDHKELTIPFEDLKGIVAEYLRNKSIEHLEEMEAQEIIDGYWQQVKPYILSRQKKVIL